MAEKEADEATGSLGRNQNTRVAQWRGVAHDVGVSMLAKDGMDAGRSVAEIRALPGVNHLPSKAVHRLMARITRTIQQFLRRTACIEQSPSSASCSSAFAFKSVMVAMSSRGQKGLTLTHRGSFCRFLHDGQEPG